MNGRVKTRKDPPAETCALTGLLLGRSAREKFALDVQESLRVGESISLALIDLDEFALTNKSLGSERADQLLKAVAKKIRQALPESAPFARLAGDCFMALLPRTEPEEALLALQSVRAAVARSPIAVGKAALRREAHPTVSVGIATGPRDGDSFEAVLARAQSALRRAKSLGRDRVASPPDDRMVLKTSYYSQTQMERLKALAAVTDVNESTLLREALEDLLLKYKERTR
jgi:diguanylate cyclase (GGDEF)-like protein